MPSLVGPLQAIGGAVIGVMLQLAGTFAWHTVFPSAVWTQPDLAALALTAGAAWLLIQRQWSAVQVLGVCVLAGLARQWL